MRVPVLCRVCGRQKWSVVSEWLETNEPHCNQQVQDSGEVDPSGASEVEMCRGPWQGRCGRGCGEGPAKPSKSKCEGTLRNRQEQEDTEPD